MTHPDTMRRILFKVVEFVALSVITLLVSPLVMLAWLLDIAERLKRRNHSRIWPQKTAKGFYHNRNNPVIQG